MNVEQMINPPAIVRSVNENEHDVNYWHELAVQVSQQRDLSNLKHAQCLYHINEDEGFKKLGYETMGEYLYSNFGRGKSWGDKLIAIHKKMVIQLGISEKELQEATFGKISKILAHINEENKEEVLTNIKDMSQKQVDEYVKQLQGENPIENEEEKNEGQLRFKGPIEIIESVNSALDLAGGEILATSTFYKTQQDIPPLLCLEFLAANFLAGVSLDGNPYETLDRAIKALEHSYNIKISYDKEIADE